MPEVTFVSFHLGLEFSCEIRSIDTEVRNRNEGSTKALHPQVDIKEGDLSPIGQRMQQRARKQAKQRQIEEQKADAESLYLLEAETAANSAEAKAKDRESLETLLRCTKRLERNRKRFKTPVRTSFWPPARHFKGMNGTPLSFEPPFSTPSEVRQIYEKNEFEEFLAKSRAASTVAKRSSRNSFTSLLESAKSSNAEPTTAIEQSAHMKSQVQSVLDLVDEVEKKDREDEMALTREEIESPDVSPTSSIKHLPRDGLSLYARIMMEQGNFGELFDDDESRSESSDSDDGSLDDQDEEKGPHTPESANSSASSEEDWEVV